MLPGKNISPDDIALIAWRRKWYIVIPFVVATVATVFITARLPNMYQSETMILVVPQRVPESYVRSTVTMRIEDRLQSLRSEILSRSRLERIITDFNLYADDRRSAVMEDVVEHMRTAINIETVRGDSFRVRYISHDPRLAQAVTARLASLFIDENVRDRADLADGTSEFLQSQLDAARGQLIGQEKRLEAYRLQYAGELPSQAESNVEAMRTSRMQLQSITESINRDRDRQVLVERQVAEMLTAPAPGAAAAPPVSIAPEKDAGTDPSGGEQSVEAQLDSARQRLAALQGRYTDSHPDVVRLKRTVARLEGLATPRPAASGAAPAQAAVPTIAQASQERRVGIARLELETIGRQIAAKQVEEKRLTGEIEQYRKRLEAAPVRESELIELNRDYETIQSQYKSLLAKREDSKISANLERRQVGEQFRILDPARLPEREYSPDRARLNVMGAAFGLLLGLAIVGGLEYLDTSFKNEQEIRTLLGLPVLAVVPDMPARRLPFFLWRRPAVPARARP